MGIIGCGRVGNRFPEEAKEVNGIKIIGAYDIDLYKLNEFSEKHCVKSFETLEQLYSKTDAVYIATPHLSHYSIALNALQNKKHVLCETPIVLKKSEASTLFDTAQKKGLILMEANKTAHAPAFNHLMVMIKSGVIGEVVDIDASLSKLWTSKLNLREYKAAQAGGSINELASYPLLPIIKLYGTGYLDCQVFTRIENGIDMFTKGILRYPKGSATFKVGLGVKTEGNLIISGTKGYAYVPSPWWKTDYFELRYEDQNENKKFFYKWDNYGLRYEIQEFISCIVNNRMTSSRLTRRECECIIGIIEQFHKKENVFLI